MYFQPKYAHRRISQGFWVWLGLLVFHSISFELYIFRLGLAVEYRKCWDHQHKVFSFLGGL